MSRKKTRQTPKRVLRLPDLDFAKSAVLNTLRSSESKRSYRFAVDDFVAWYCSEPRLAFNKTVVLRYRLELESRRLSSSTINLRHAAVRRLAHEAADTGLLSPELAANIRRVKGAKRIGVRLGNWLSAEQAKVLVQAAAGFGESYKDSCRTNRPTRCSSTAYTQGCCLRRKGERRARRCGNQRM